MPNDPVALPSNTPGEKQFLIAASSGDLEACRVHLDAGENPNAVLGGFHRPHSALHLAVSWNHPEVCALLLERGADVNFVDDDKDSALYMACKEMNSDVVRILLKNGADFLVPNAKGMNFLDLMVRHFEPVHYPELVQSMSNTQIKLANQRMNGFLDCIQMNLEVGYFRQKIDSFKAVFNSRLAMVAMDDLIDGPACEHRCSLPAPARRIP